MSIPFPIFWNGFRSDLFELRSHGWMASVDLSHAMDSASMILRIFLQNKRIDMMGYIGAEVDYRAFRSIDSVKDIFKHTRFDVSEMAHNLHHRVITHYDSRFMYSATGAMPTNGIMTVTYNTADGQIFSNGPGGSFNQKDIVRFQGLEEEGLLIEKAGVEDLLSAILEKQAPKQDEIRERRRLDAEKGKIWMPEQKLILLSS